MKLLFKRMRRYTLRALLIVAALLVLLFGSAAVLVSTPAGSAWLLEQVAHFTPGTLRIGAVRGRLIDDLTLEKISYQKEDLDLAVTRLHLIWRPGALLDRHLHVLRLQAVDTRLKLPSSAPTVQSNRTPGPLVSMPGRIALPISIMLDHLQLDGIRLRQDGQEQQIDKAELSARLQGDRLQVKQLQLTARGAQLGLNGSATLSGHYPLSLKTNWRLPLSMVTALQDTTPAQPPESKELSGTGQLKGDLTRLHISLDTKGALEAVVDGQVSQLLSANPAWQAHLDLQKVKLGSLQPTLATLSLSSTVDVKGDMKHAEFTVEGRTDDPRSGPLDFHAHADVDARRLQFHRFQISQPGSPQQINGSGEVSWQPVLHWRADIEARHLQPEKFGAPVTGNLNTQVSLMGQMADTLSLKAQIKSLQGSLQSQPVDGSAEVTLQGTQIDIPRLALNWGSARVKAQGSVGKRVDMNWQLSVPDLAQLWPGSQGSVQGQGHIQGATTLPGVKADLSISRLVLAQTQVDKLNARIDFSPSGAQTNIDLVASKIKLSGQSVDSANLSVSGPNDRLQIAFKASNALGQISTQAVGALRTALPDWQWQGQLQKLDLDTSQAGRWHLAKPTTFAARPGSYSLDTLCLNAAQRAGSVCLDGRWQGGVAKAAAQIQGLSLALFAPFLPDSTHIKGEVNARAQIESHGQQFKVSADAQLPKTEITLPETNMRLQLASSSVTVSGNQNRIDTELHLPLSSLQGGINGNLSIDRPLAQQRLKGKLDARIDDLKPLSVLMPTIHIEQGRAQAGLVIGGTLAAPVVNGSANLDQAAIEVPAAGISVKQITLGLQEDGGQSGRMRVTGTASSGKGNLALDGYLVPAQKSVQLTVKGDSFVAMDTKEVHLLVSPDMNLQISPERVRVRGDLTVPEALIKPAVPTLGANQVSASPDLVIERPNQAQASRGPKLDVDMRVNLGDSVRVDAFGFNGLLNGSLNLQQQDRGLARGTGSIGVASGQYTLYGQKLDIKRGSFVYTGGALTNPGLDLLVARQVDEVQVGAQVSGTLRKPDMTLTSQPAMPDNSILSYLLLGHAPNANSTGEQAMLMKLALSLGAKGGNMVTDKLAKTLNVDDLGFSAGDTADSASFYIGKYLTPDLYLKYGIGLINPVSTFLMRYRLSKHWSLETDTNAQSSGGDLIYTLEH